MATKYAYLGFALFPGLALAALSLDSVPAGYKEQEVKIELVGKAFRGGKRGDRPGFDTCLVGAVGSCLEDLYWLVDLLGVFGDIDPEVCACSRLIEHCINRTQVKGRRCSQLPCSRFGLLRSDS
ncbi:hypothetical protein SDJN03_18680, partial [Cucurbita argyrosperma subsp. sororia]